MRRAFQLLAAYAEASRVSKRRQCAACGKRIERVVNARRQQNGYGARVCSSWCANAFEILSECAGGPRMDQNSAWCVVERRNTVTPKR